MCFATCAVYISPQWRSAAMIAMAIIAALVFLSIVIGWSAVFFMQIIHYWRVTKNPPTTETRNPNYFPDRFICGDCGEVFKNIYSYNDHMYHEHGWGHNPRGNVS